MSGNEELSVISKLLVKKLGVEMMTGILTGAYEVTKVISTDKRRAYYRSMKEYKTPFTNYSPETKTHEELPPEIILDALEDAADKLSYSNWHGDKFDRAAEILFRYCQEHNIKIDRDIEDISYND